MSAPEAIGVDLGGTKMAVGVVGRDQRVHYRNKEPSLGRSEEELIADLKRELVEAKEARPDVVAAGMGIPCTIDRERGVAINAVNLPLAGVPIRELMTEHLGLPVFIDNDANVAALAEYLYGAGRGAQNVVLMTIGTGIGGGLILNGKVYRGSSGAGAELGHTVIDVDGPPCQGTCPNHGCVEAMASGTALAREGREAAQREPDSALGKVLAAGEEITGKTVSDAALEGDPIARDVVALIGSRIGVAATSLANTFDPDVIVLGGGVMAVGDLLLDPARREIQARALPPMNRVPIVAAELGPEAGMIGAAAMAIIELGEPV
jgi:glucokinase